MSYFNVFLAIALAGRVYSSIFEKQSNRELAMLQIRSLLHQPGLWC